MTRRICLYFRPLPEQDRWPPGDRFVRPTIRRLIRGRPGVGGVEKVFHNLFIGSKDVLRADFFGHAAQAGAEFVARGAGWSAAGDNTAPQTQPRHLLRTAGLEQMYEIGSDIETFETVKEFCVKLEDLKRDKARRRLMRQRAQRKALSELSATRSALRIYSQLGLRSK